MMSRLLLGLVLAVVCAPAAWAQSVTASIDDVRVIEGDSGTAAAVFTVTLSSAADATIDWTTDVSPAPPGSATAGVDYVAGAGTLTFLSAGSASQQVTVTVNGDTGQEGDETFYVDLSNAAGATLTKRRGVATILDDDDDQRPPAECSAVLTDWDVDRPRTRLQFRRPASDDLGGTADYFRINWNTGTTCNFPPAPNATAAGIADCVPDPFPGPGETVSCDVADLTPVNPIVLADLVAGETYCYAIWVHFTSGRFSRPEANVKVKTLDAAPGAHVWSFATGDGLTNVVPPSLTSAAIYTVAGNGEVHALTRGATGGTWPAGWNPVSVGDGVSWRSPAVPLSGQTLLFVVTDNTSANEQRMHAVNAENGSLVWSTLPVTPAPEGGPGPAAGILAVWGGAQDMLVMGTTASTNDNRIYAFDPYTGETIGVFPDADDTDPGMGMVAASTVDYATNRLFFTTRKGTAPETLWSLQILPGAGTVDLDLDWAVELVNGVDQAPVLRSGRLLLGDNGGEVYSVADNGLDQFSRSTGDGAPKMFLFPDSRNGNVYFSTIGEVHAWSNDGTQFIEDWVLAVPTPSVPLWWRGENFVYVGGGDGQLHQIAADTGAAAGTVFLGPQITTQIGAPSYDRANNLLLVGGTDGVIHAVDPEPIGGPAK